jgi:DNA-binding XRE family transcriptional regulator
VNNAKSVAAFKAHARKALADPDIHPLKLARIRLGIRQNDLADMAHLSRRTVMKIEAGEGCNSTTKAAIEEILCK